MLIQHTDLKTLVNSIFIAAGSSDKEADSIARHLVEANLVGHDSHGVIRVAQYIGWIREGKAFLNKHAVIINESDTFAVLDGQFGFGQVIGEEAVALGIKKAHQHGISVIGLRNAGHLGRIGDWAVMAAEAGLVSVHFVNSNGFAILAAPYGGTDRRLSSNPISVDVPTSGAFPLILDMATCSVSEGKIMVAKNAGKKLPDGLIIDGKGQPTNDPNVFYANPPGAILPLSPGYKGYGLSFMCELLAGALTGGDTSSPKSPTAGRMANGMLSIYLDQTRFSRQEGFIAEIEKLTDWVKTSPKAEPKGEILLPGELEYCTKEDRMKNGISLDETTAQQLLDAAKSVGVDAALTNPLVS